MLQQQAETTCSLRRYFCFLVLLLTYFMNLLATWVLLSGPAECAERSAAPPQVAPRAKLQIKVLANIYEAKSVIIKSPSLDLVLPPLYLSPGLRTFRRADPKITYYLSCWQIFSNFWPSGTRFKNDFEKT